ncbi:MAG: alpha/beta fold hydrolase [Gammaproteobacteria bacterium]|nr:alpha/beta fold hydrolase [Gammaproteobacteria bacterium]NNL50896.1 alpha/beta hydrolase [Woeseiaceae bacterium]
MNTWHKFLALLLLTQLASCSGAENLAHKSGRVVIDDYQLAYVCAGQESPTIFLETPSGLSAEESFSPIFQEIAIANKVCRFDRLGMGDSDPVPEGLNQTVRDYSRELEALVDLVSPDDDIVIVGYSFGGLVARYYAAHNPSRVKGLLLIDAAHEDWLREMKIQMSFEDWQKMQEILDWFTENLGHNVWDSQLEIEQAPALQRSLPIRIISRGRDFQRIRLAEISEDGFRIYNDLHNKYQAAQELLSEETSRVIAANSEHYIPESEPELVLEELGLLLSQIRAGM